MKEGCKKCDINQIKKVCSILSIDKKQEKQLDEAVEQYLDNVDMNKCNPEAMEEIWSIMSEIIQKVKELKKNVIFRR